MITVTSDVWVDTCREFADRDVTVVDWLTAIDRESEIEIVACLVNPGTGDCALVSCRVPSNTPIIPSLAADFPGAEWHERETAEMFGVEFVGRPSTEALLLRGPGASPLRKATALPARVQTPWPGAEPESGRRRRKLPPGVRTEWVVDGE
jgi:NADH-quinone oxidoreductase subunit C